MVTVLRRPHTAHRLRRGAALVATVAALGGSALYASASRDAPRASTLLEPARRSEFWDEPEPRCLLCHQRDDHRLDPARRTAYAQLTLDPIELASE